MFRYDANEQDLNLRSEIYSLNLRIIRSTIISVSEISVKSKLWKKCSCI